MALVCVTGGSGFLASWLIKLLLERGYTVRATVRDPGNLKKTAHLQKLPHARERLELVKADLLDDDSFDAAVEGCEGVFHVASPVKVLVDNPEEELIIPAVKGTLNVLNACAKHKSVRRVVLTSSLSAVRFQALAISGSILVDESCWSDEDYCKEKKLWYPVSKLLAEQRAWEFAKEKGLDLVVLTPGLTAGRPLQESLDIGTKAVLDILTGQGYRYTVASAWVGVRDVAEAHLLALEAPTAFGRYICAERVMDCPTVLEILRNIIANHALLPKYADQQLPPASIWKVSTEKLQELGLTCRPIEDALKETVEYLIERGHLPQDLQIVS